MVAEWGLGINLLENALSFEEASLKAAAPHSVDFVKWMKKIKTGFDPRNVAESAFYVTPDACARKSEMGSRARIARQKWMPMVRS